MTFRAGIIGCGRIGSEFAENNLPTHAGSYCAVPEIQLVALCDMDTAKLAKAGKRWGVTALYTDYREMLGKENLDILSICTWSVTHLEILRQAVRNRVKAVYCEKPIADTLRAADEMVRLCRESGVILQVNHQRRFDRFYQDVREFIKSGRLGVMQQANFYYTRGVANTGSHAFDLLRFFFDNAAWVQAAHSNNLFSGSEDPNLDGMIKFTSGLFGVVQACDDRYFPIFEMHCLGSKGRLNIIHNGSDVEYYRVIDGKLQHDTFPVNPAVPRNAMVNAVQHLLDCLRKSQESISSGEDGKAALELICAFHESARADGRRIALPLVECAIEIKSR